MKLSSIKKQTILLTSINAIVRALGLSMRIWLSRALGAEILGMIEMSQSVHMVAITPLTSGLPVAISRLCVKSKKPENVLADAFMLVKRVSLFLMPVMLMTAPLLASFLGNRKVLPLLLFNIPCIMILGYSAACNGYCYGIEKSEIPAASELLEQGSRFLLTVLLVRSFSKLTAPWLAALPVVATTAAELIGLLFVLLLLRKRLCGQNSELHYIRPLYQLALPTTLTRLLQTLLRSATAVMIPLRLQASGLSAAEATSRLGMLNGMVFPVLMVPGIFTSALAMVITPRITQAETHPAMLRKLLFKCVAVTLPFAFLCAFSIWSFAPFLANNIYRQADVALLFRLSCFQTVLLPANHLLGTTLSSLGLQKKTFYISLVSSAVSIVLTWLLAALPSYRLYGVIAAQYASLLCSLIGSLFVYHTWRKKEQLRFDDKFVLLHRS